MTLHDHLQREGFAFVTADIMRGLLGPAALTDWMTFAASWNDLAPDSYLASTGRHRERRHATFRAGINAGVQRQPHQPHYQPLKYNPLQGDMVRWFEPITPTVADGDCMRTILTFCHTCFGALAPNVRLWHVEVHQFRIQARADEEGEPTPEGVHHDGVDYVLVLLVDRENIERGTTTIHATDGSELGSFTLTHPLDAAMVDDQRVLHGVTAVTPSDPSRPAHRDVLVVTFRREPASD